MSATGLNEPDIAWRRGYSLPRACYVDASVFDREVDRFLSRHWIAAAHVSDLPRPGDWVRFEAFGYSVVIVRASDGTLGAFHNSCRHRGARVCEGERGHDALLRCRYHGWTYRLDGSLAAWRHMPDGLAKDDFGLQRCGLAELHGLVYVSMRPAEAPDFAALTQHVRTRWERYGLQDCRVAATEIYRLHANWKLAVENNLECYHCMPSHPEYTSANAFVRADERVSEATVADFDRYSREWRERMTARGIATEVSEFLAIDGQLCRSGTYPLAPGFSTGTHDGRPVAPLLGTIDTYDESVTTGCVGFLSYVGAMCDHAIQLTIVPRSVDATDVVLRWLVRADARAGVDYDPARLTWLWGTTTRQDKDIVELNAAGVTARGYEPGPYSRLESIALDFVERYAALMELRVTS